MPWSNQPIVSPVVIVVSGGTNQGLFVYSGTPAAGNPPQFAVVAPGVTKDPFGNAITSSKILVQGNIITESGGVFRTAASAPLIQLDGPHDAVLVYDASAVLRETVAPVATTDGLGNTVQAGFTSYGSVNTTWVRLFQQLISFSNASDTTNGFLGENADGSISIQSSTQASTGTAATLQLLPGASQSAAVAQFEEAVALAEQAIPPAGTNATVGPKLFGSNASGMARFVSDTSTGLGDGQPYDMGRRSLQNSSNFTLPTTTPATITGLSTPVVAGTYRVNLDLLVTIGSTATNLTVGLSGPAVSSDTSLKWQFYQDSTGGQSMFSGHNVGALGNTTEPGTTWPAGATVQVHMQGWITFTAAGTLAAQAAIGTTSTGSQVSLASHMDVMPVG